MLEREERRHRVRVRAGAGVALLVGLLVSFIVARSVLPEVRRALASEFAQSVPPPDAGWVVEPLAVAPALDAATGSEPRGSAPDQPTDPPGKTPQPADPPSGPEPKSADPLDDTPAPKPSVRAQRFKIAVGARGYEPSAITADGDRPIELTVAQGEGCAAGFLMPTLGVEEDNSTGPVTIRLGRLEPGSYTFTCGMAMVTGKITVR